MIRVICLLIGYLCGLLQSGFIVGKFKGIDIRNHGSKNAGTTNVLRTMGLKYALIVFLLDALKCGLAIIIVKMIFGGEYGGIIKLLQIYAALGVILGHNYPFYMNFRGGKGIAATAGLVVFGFPPIITLISIIVFFTTFFVTHYVSLGSLFLYVGLIIEVVLLGEYSIRHSDGLEQIKFFKFDTISARASLNEFYIILFILAVIAFVRHKENIKRLLSGTERKTYLKGKPELDVDKKEN